MGRHESDEHLATSHCQFIRAPWGMEEEHNPSSVDPEGLPDKHDADSPPHPDEEKHGLIPKEDHVDELSDNETDLWNGRALRVAVTSLIYTLCVMCLSLSASLALDSSTLLGMAVEAAADSIGDVLVIWRFSGDQNDPEIQSYDNQATVGIAFVMLGCCMFVCASAARKLAHHTDSQSREWVVWTHCIVAVCSGVLTFIKMVIARKVKSQVLFLDACTGGMIAVIGMMYVIISSVKTAHPEVWWMDSAFAVLLCFVIFAIAVWNLSQYNWTNPEFWTVFEKAKAAVTAQSPHQENDSEHSHTK